MTLLSQAPAIVVFRYRFIGDTVLSIPMLRDLRQAAPQAVIHYVASPGSGEVLTHCPYVDRLWYLSNKPTKPSNHLRYEVETAPTLEETPTVGEPIVEAPLSYWDLAKRLRGQLPKGSVAFVLKRSWSSALLACLSGATHRVGFNTEGRRLLLTHPMEYDKTLPEWQCFLQTLQPFGQPVGKLPHAWSHPALEGWWSAEDNAHADNLLSFIPDFSHNTPILPVGLHLTATDATKTLPLQVASEATQALLDRYPQLVFCCVGAQSDSSTYETLRATWPPEWHHRLLNLCGQATLLQSQAVLSKLALVVGVDSGVLHLAAAVQTPVVGLYLPNKRSKWLPPVDTTGAIPMLTPLTLPISANALVQSISTVLDTIVAHPRGTSV
ncbi:MAG: glycosyltransferase family 9 protein [Vampirovibrionales bacterium]|nr:glycosyltransferase family 9 protein [Vampirovibrionales bacterium]